MRPYPSLLRYLRPVLSVVCLMTWDGVESLLAEEPPVKILLMGHDKDGHPPETHEYLPEMHLLARCLEQSPGVTTIVSNRWPTNPADAEQVAAMVLYVPWGGNILFDGPQRATMETLLAARVGLVAVHWSTGAVGSEAGEFWLRALGGWFHTDFSPIEHVEVSLEPAQPEHPVLVGCTVGKWFDEYYWDLRFAPTAQPLLTAEQGGKRQVVGWTYERAGGGRSFGLVAGHYHQSWADATFRRLVTNAVLWSARREVPAGGAPCALSAEELKLPAAPDAK